LDCPLAVGVNEITVTVVSVDGTSEQYTITVIRAAPTAVTTINGAIGTLQGVPVVINVLANATPPDGTAINLAAVSPGSNGATTINPDGSSVTYTPAPPFFGLDYFTYTVAANNGATGVGLIAVVVTRVDQSNAPEVSVILSDTTTNLSFNAGNVNLVVPPGSYNGPMGPTDIFYIAYTEIVTPTANTTILPGGLRFAGKIFTLEAFFNNIELDNYVFPQPVTLTVRYDPSQINELRPETLSLFYWDEATQRWSQDGLTFVSRDTENHTITYLVAHFTEFAYFGSSTPTALEPEVEPELDNWIYLPAVQR
jgi:hypothetical protein